MGCDKQWLLAYKLNISLFFKINNRTFIIDVQLAAKNLSVISHSLLLAYLPNHCYQHTIINKTKKIYYIIGQRYFMQSDALLFHYITVVFQDRAL